MHKDVRSALRKAIEEIEDSSTFFACNKITEFVDPCLEVDAGGPISLPLQDVDARRIIAASHQAPFGKGSETIIDTSVRRTWELNHDQFTMGNEDGFDAVLEDAIEQTCASLGLSDRDDIQAELYKLLLYEEGALFRPHTEYASLVPYTNLC